MHSLSSVLLWFGVQVRILDVLLSVPHRDDRAAMLPDAFDPPASSLGRPQALAIRAAMLRMH